jgi:hypothetical protein
VWKIGVPPIATFSKHFHKFLLLNIIHTSLNNTKKLLEVTICQVLISSRDLIKHHSSFSSGVGGGGDEFKKTEEEVEE